MAPPRAPESQQWILFRCTIHKSGLTACAATLPAELTVTLLLLCRLVEDSVGYTEVLDLGCQRWQKGYGNEGIKEGKERWWMRNKSPALQSKDRKEGRRSEMGVRRGRTGAVQGSQKRCENDATISQ